jgi:hypothetical protein
VITDDEIVGRAYKCTVSEISFHLAPVISGCQKLHSVSRDGTTSHVRFTLVDRSFDGYLSEIVPRLSRRHLLLVR